MTLTAGFFNPVHPWGLQVLGEAGARYLAGLAPVARSRLARKLAAGGTAVLVVARGAGVDAKPWMRAGVEVRHEARPAHEIVHALRRELARGQAAHALVHGVLLEVHGVGVLVRGPAGSGKGTLALDLLSRGHALVADDAVELWRPAPGVVLGHGPALLAGYLEVRGLGVLDVRRMHGRRAVRDAARVDLVVRLAPGPGRLDARARLSGRRGSCRVLGERLPRLDLPARPRGARTGDNPAALVEAACLDWRLRQDGIEADAALARRQARALERKA